jgi:hypothetical protein
MPLIIFGRPNHFETALAVDPVSILFHGSPFKFSLALSSSSNLKQSQSRFARAAQVGLHVFRASRRLDHIEHMFQQRYET